MKKILFLMLIFALLLPNLGSGDELTGAVIGKVNLTVPAFVIIKHPEINRTYSSTNSTIFLNITFTNPATSCWRSANNGNNETLENASSASWFQNVFTNQFGFNNISAYCNNTIGNVFYNRTRFFLENSTSFISSIVNISLLAPGESLSDYVKVSNFNVSVFEKDFYENRNISLEIRGLIGVLIYGHLFESDKANLTVLKYEKAPPRVPSLSSVTAQRELKYFDARAYGFSRGFAIINLSYQDSEISGYNETTLSVFRKLGNSWIEPNVTSRNEIENKIAIVENVTALNETVFVITGAPLPQPPPTPARAAPTEVGVAPSPPPEGIKIGLPVTPPKPDQISVDRGFIKISLHVGETKSETLEITNLDDKELNVSIVVENISRFLIPSEFDFKLKPKEKKTIILNAVAFKQTKPEIYAGSLKIKAGYTEKTVDTLIAISSEQQLFNVFIEVPNEFKKVIRGDTASAKIRILHLGGTKIDVKIRYGIRSIDGNDIVANEELLSLGAGEKIESARRFKPSLNPGKYLFYIILTYGDVVVTDSDIFEVVEKEVDILLLVSVAFAIILFLIFISVIYLRRGKRARQKARKPVEAEDLTKI